jgi:hypothetical protein
MAMQRALNEYLNPSGLAGLLFSVPTPSLLPTLCLFLLLLDHQSHDPLSFSHGRLATDVLRHKYRSICPLFSTNASPISRSALKS